MYILYIDICIQININIKDYNIHINHTVKLTYLCPSGGISPLDKCNP